MSGKTPQTSNPVTSFVALAWRPSAGLCWLLAAQAARLKGQAKPTRPPAPSSFLVCDRCAAALCIINLPCGNHLTAGSRNKNPPTTVHTDSKALAGQPGQQGPIDLQLPPGSFRHGGRIRPRVRIFHPISPHQHPPDRRAEIVHRPPVHPRAWLLAELCLTDNPASLTPRRPGCRPGSWTPQVLQLLLACSATWSLGALWGPQLPRLEIAFPSFSTTHKAPSLLWPVLQRVFFFWFFKASPPALKKTKARPPEHCRPGLLSNNRGPGTVARQLFFFFVICPKAPGPPG